MSFDYFYSMNFHFIKHNAKHVLLISQVSEIITPIFFPYVLSNELNFFLLNCNTTWNGVTLDRVKKSNASRIKLPSQLHVPLYISSNESEYNLNAACQISPAMSIFKETGWALPDRSNFRYT